MDFYAIIFYVFAALTLVGAFIVVTSRNIVRSAFALLFTLFGVAGFFVLLTADFLAITQLMIYVGGILALIIFGVMLTQSQINVDIRSGSMQTVPALLLTGLLAGVLSGVYWGTDWRVMPSPAPAEATGPRIGELLMTSYLLPFEVASVILLVALVGAALIARRDKKTS